ncbi:hypothetical protein JX266_004437 [Neoarthrinium moseri]|nr:hypothetical protein JX266_004437 [Neoarthrinium moseri]
MSLQHIIASTGELVSFCNPSSFPSPNVPGTNISNIIAEPVLNFSGEAPWYYNFNNPGITVANATFCNVTVTYDHPGQNDLTAVRAYLPISSPAWNGRFQAVGGGGWVAGMGEVSFLQMIGALGNGYATITTDASLANPLGEADSWAMVSEGNVNLYKLQNLASASLRDEALIGKSLIHSFYGEAPQYSYWSGCSQGGRQGMQLAQRYPGLYDGIAASAPAVNWAESVAAIFWPQLVINQLLGGTKPADCEVNRLTALAIETCDGLDGIVDGIVSDIALCEETFNAFDYVGTSFTCASTNQSTSVSRGAAVFANATWQGPRTADGRFLWHGLNIGAPITDAVNVGNRQAIGAEWLRLFVKKNSTFDVNSMILDEYEWLFHRGVAEYDSIIGTSDANLREFKRRNGKLMTFHGLWDQTLPTKATEDYFDRVSEMTGAEAADFARLFVVPGLYHCAGGPGGQPTALFSALTNWVENGTAPDTVPISFIDQNNTTNERILCPHPSRAVWDGTGPTSKASSFYCTER